MEQQNLKFILKVAVFSAVLIFTSNMALADIVYFKNGQKIGTIGNKIEKGICKG